MLYHFDHYSLDSGRQELRRDDQFIAIESKVFQVLLYLLENRDRVISKDELLEQCWPDTCVSESALYRCLTRLRKVIQGELTSPQIIKTLHRRGYRFVAEVTVLPDGPIDADQLQGASPPPVLSLRAATELESHLNAPETTAPPSQPLSTAERRQLTILLCGLVNAATLAEQLDSEDLHKILNAYHDVCAEVIERFGGHAAQYLGDEMSIYFGYPHAYEDAARRSVYTGLGMINAVGSLNHQLEKCYGIRLAIRIGVHTGLVVVGDVGTGGRVKQLAVGVAPTIAAHIQRLATPNTVVISQATHQLSQGYFETEMLGEHVLRGVAEPTAVYRVLRTSGVQSRLDIPSARGLTPLVGRESEVALLLDRWEQVQDGRGQVVLLSGEAGIGKSRLVQVLKEQVAATPHSWWECRSSPYYQNTALYPITDLLQRAMGWEPDDGVEVKLNKLEEALARYSLALEEAVPLLADLWSLPAPQAGYARLNLTPQRQRQKTLEMLAAILVEESERQPMFFVIEDLHWTDPTTLELLELLVGQNPTAAVLILLTCRPEFEPPWPHRTHLSGVSLPRLTRRQMERMIERVTHGKRLPEEVAKELIEKTDGVPLYLEEMTKSVIESGALKEHDDRYELVDAVAPLAIPMTLQDSLLARLDRMGAAKGIAQLGATIGRQFSYVLIQAVSSLDELTLEQSLTQLVEAELLRQQGFFPQARFTFKHALIQDAAFASLLRRTRQQLHQQIAQVLEAQFPETKTTQPELLAYHLAEAGLTDQAIPYWQRAGEQAVHRSANSEAIAHLQKALGLLHTAPATAERTRQELTLQRMLGVSLLATKGFGATEVETAYSRARELCQQVGDISHTAPVIFGLWGYYHLRNEQQTARVLADELLALAKGSEEAGYRLMGHRAMGDTLYHHGEFVLARDHLERGIALYDADHHGAYAFIYGQDPLVGYQLYMAHVLWILGYPDQALRMSEAAISSARQLKHPFSLAFASTQAVVHRCFRREWCAVLEQTDRLLSFCEEHAFAQSIASVLSFKGLALAMTGNQEGYDQLRQGAADRQKTGARPRALVLMFRAALYRTTGDVEEGLHVIDEALAITEESGERCSEAELHRLKGALLFKKTAPDTRQAETCFYHALDIARRQQAKSWELRAATSLARVWQSQGKRQEACDLLNPIYNWFTEGFDTPDLQDAKVLLEEVA